MNYREYYSFLGFLRDLLWQSNFKGEKTDSCFMQTWETTQRTSPGIDPCGKCCSALTLYLGSRGSFSLVCTSPNHTFFPRFEMFQITYIFMVAFFFSKLILHYHCDR